MKFCSGCCEDKPLDQFHKRGDSVQSQCKSCKKLWHGIPSNKRKQKDRKLKKRYKISLEEYSKMFKEQKEVCKICKRSIGKRYLSVDHNHNTGKVRGLLCGGCNLLVGFLENESSRVENARKYLEENK